MMWVKSNEKEILTILDNLAKKGVETAEALEVLVSDVKNSKDHHNKIKKLEREADDLTRSVFAELNKTFITPLDREDIQRIAAKVDDVIDYMEGISGRMVSYNITETPPFMIDIARELTSATKEVEYMISKLRNLKDPKDLMNHVRKTSDIEHTIDDLYRSAVGKLFESKDPILIIKLKDIYEGIETASDRTVDVADVVEDIILKYT